MPNKNIILSKSDSYFAAINTSHGLENRFGEIFGKCKHLIILKGGPGTGKSTLIRLIGAEAENRDMPVEYFYCSSDTSSLDGAVISNGILGIVDGTAPHVMETKIPGARDEIVNLGSFWSRSLLSRSGDKIEDIISKKASLYNEVYSLLSISASAEDMCENIVRRHIDFGKMSRAADRLSCAFEANSGISRYRGISALGVQGFAHLDTYEKNSERIYYFRDRYSLSHIFLEMLKEKLEAREVGIDYSLSPVRCKYDALFIRDEKTAFISSVSGDEKIINTERFIKKSISSEKDEIKQLRAVSSGILKTAEKKLSHIGELHSELEKIYIDAMDFKALNDFTKRLLISIFKNLPC